MSLLALLGAGLLAGRLPRPAVLVAGGLCAVIGLLALANPRLRRPV